MTLDEITKAIAEIEATKWDDESAHSAEDRLRDHFIRYVSTLEIPSLAEKARLVLSTGGIDFERWCA